MDANKKKQMKYEYKTKPSVGAVYAIDCSGNNRRYIRSTVDIGGIKNRFKFATITGGCPDPSLNVECRQYGAETFSLVVLEELKMKEGQTAGEFANDIKQLYELWLEKSAETE